MKHIITLLAIVIASATLSSCTKKYDEYGLNCKVKSVLEQSYSAKQKFGEIDRDICVNLELLEFNNDRQMTSKSMFYDWGFKPGDDLELREKVIYKYNDQGLMVQMDEYNKDGDFTGKEVYKYNDQGLKTEEYWYNSDNEVSYHWHTEYNDAGNETLAVSFNPDGSENSRHEWTYNNNNCPISVVHYENGKVFLKQVWNWNEDKLISVKSYFDDGSVHTDDNPELHYFNKDKNGLELNADHDNWGYVTYEYVTFDKKGNWTKRYAHDSETNEVKYITERVITY